MLKGTTLLIGKEPGNGRLLISITGNGFKKTVTLGEYGSVPDSVSRCKPEEGVGHCKISIDENSKMTLTNLKIKNVTYVDNMEVSTKHIDGNSKVSLGQDRYALNIKAILDLAEKTIPQQAKELSIKHLEAIWDIYDQALEKLQIEQQKKANQQRLQGILSMSGMLFALLPFPDSVRILRVIFIVAALGLAIFFFIKGSNVKDSFIFKKKELDKQFIKDYVCPNSECHHFMGTQPYMILRQNKKCPYCGCKYSDK